MMAVALRRPTYLSLQTHLQGIRRLAESCCRQLAGWMGSLENSPVQGKRHLDAKTRQRKERASAAQEFRRDFLLSLATDHPKLPEPVSLGENSQ